MVEDLIMKDLFLLLYFNWLFRGLFLTLGALTGNTSLILLISVLLVACLPFIKFKEEIDYEYVFDNEI